MSKFDFKSSWLTRDSFFAIQGNILYTSRSCKMEICKVFAGNPHVDIFYVSEKLEVPEFVQKFKDLTNSSFLDEYIQQTENPNGFLFTKELLNGNSALLDVLCILLRLFSETHGQELNIEKLRNIVIEKNRNYTRYFTAEFEKLMKNFDECLPYLPSLENKYQNTSLLDSYGLLEFLKGKNKLTEKLKTL